jgi:antirestriction protein ArdC
MEELVAELSSAILGAELGLPVDHLDHHASYLASWLKVLKADSRAILTVAAKAEEAASLLLQLGRGEASGASDGNAMDELPQAIAA